MCNFITGVLEAAADTPRFRALVEESRLRFSPLVNPAITPQLRSSERYFHVTRTWCDCNTNLARPPKARPASERVRKLRDRGWSQAKIDAWVASKDPRRDRTDAGADLLGHAQWMLFLDRALQLPSCAYVGLLMHDYRRSTFDEVFTITSRTPVTTEQLRDEAHAWEKNVLYEVRNGT